MEKDVPSFVPSDALSQAIVTIAERSQVIVSEFLDRQTRDQSIASAIDPLHIGDAFLQMTSQMLASPVTLVEAQMSMWNDYMQMWQHTAQHMLGAPAEPEPQTGQASWRQSDIFDFIKQTYLLTARWIQSLVKKVDGLDEDSARQVDFYTRQFIDAMDPSNLFANNPELLSFTVENHGENLVKGLDHLLGELERSKARLANSGTPSGGFKVGKTVAASKGDVLFRNAAIELLHYAPAGEKQLRTPMLIIPPWTHKFYALDLRPANSLVKWAVDQGHRVFLLSWADHKLGSPDRDLAATIAEGPVAALDAIRDLTGESRVNGVGFGLGGTLLAVTQAWQAAQGEERWQSATYLGSLLDFSDSGEISVFVAEEQLQQLDDPAEGTTPDRAVIDLLRANDLIWSFVIDSFHGERTPFPFDLLQWNADSLRVSPGLQRFYLNDLYQDNRLCKPGAMSIGDTPIDLSRITAPAYVLGMNEDHLAPWSSVFAATHLLGGATRFVRAGSGHLSGAINPPDVQRFGFSTHSRAVPDAASWAKGARHQPGSWWEDWHAWLVRHSGAEVPAEKLAAPTLGSAPGRFVV